MDSKLVWILTVIAAAIIFFLGRYSVGERIVQVPVTVNPSPVQTPFIPATVDSVTYADLLTRYEELRGFLRGRDTVILIDTLNAPVYVIRSSVDTAFPTGAQVAIVQDGDSSYVWSDTKVRVSAEYIGSPFNAFRFNYIDVDPFSVEVPVVERVRENPINGEWLAFEFMGGYKQGGVRMGGQVQVRNIGVGAFLSAETAPMYFVSLRVPVL